MSLPVIFIATIHDAVIDRTDSAVLNIYPFLVIFVE